MVEILRYIARNPEAGGIAFTDPWRLVLLLLVPAIAGPWLARIIHEF